MSWNNCNIMEAHFSRVSAGSPPLLGCFAQRRQTAAPGRPWWLGGGSAAHLPGGLMVSCRCQVNISWHRRTGGELAPAPRLGAPTPPSPLLQAESARARAFPCPLQARVGGTISAKGRGGAGRRNGRTRAWPLRTRLAFCSCTAERESASAACTTTLLSTVQSRSDLASERARWSGVGRGGRAYSPTLSRCSVPRLVPSSPLPRPHTHTTHRGRGHAQRRRP